MPDLSWGHSYPELSRAARRALVAERDKHVMSWETGRCACGFDCHGNTEMADEHFQASSFLAGVRYERERGVAEPLLSRHQHCDSDDPLYCSRGRSAPWLKEHSNDEP